MRDLISYFLLALGCLAFSTAYATTSGEPVCDAALQDINPRDRKPDVWTAFTYPYHCLSGAKPEETVTLKFDVTPDGAPANVTVLRSTNNCFNAPSEQTVEQWKYSCVAEGLKDVETTTTYYREDTSPAAGFERVARCVLFDRSKHTAEKIAANPRLGTSCQTSVDYPARCVRKAEDGEHVEIKFDVTRKGKVKNIGIVESTNGCFNHRARSTISARKYSSTDNGYQDIGALIFFDKAETPPVKECRPVAAPGKGVQKAAGKNTAPRLICSSAPAYPDQCRRFAAKNEVVSFRVWVSPDGSVNRVTLKDASNDCFVAAARAAVRTYRYEPTKDGAENVVVTLSFRTGK